LRVALLAFLFLAGIAITFLIVGISPFILSRRSEVPRNGGRIGASLCGYALPTAQLRWVVALLRGIDRPWRESTNEVTNEIQSTPAIW
jgi:hypothetical protein